MKWRNRNYQILQNLKEININNEIFKMLNNINKITNIKEQIFNIIEFYNNINSDITIPQNKPSKNTSFLRVVDDLDIYLFPSHKFIVGNSNSSQSEKSECKKITKQMNRKVIMFLGEEGCGKNL